MKNDNQGGSASDIKGPCGIQMKRHTFSIYKRRKATKITESAGRIGCPYNALVTNKRDASLVWREAGGPSNQQLGMWPINTNIYLVLVFESGVSWGSSWGPLPGSFFTRPPDVCCARELSVLCWVGGKAIAQAVSVSAGGGRDDC